MSFLFILAGRISGVGVGKYDLDTSPTDFGIRRGIMEELVGGEDPRRELESGLYGHHGLMVGGSRSTGRRRALVRT